MESIIGFSLIVLLLFSAFFSASETALMSIDKIKLKNKVNKGEKNASLIEDLLSNPDQLLSTLLVGNNIVNILASSLATALFSSDRLFGHAGVAAATLIMTPLLLIFSEITPKSLASQYPFKISKRVAKPILFCIKLLYPIVKILTWITGNFLKMFGVSPKKNFPEMTEEEVRLMVNLSEETGMLKDYEKDMIQNIFEFDDIDLNQIMIPRMYMKTLSSTATYEEVRSYIVEYQFSRIPVYEESLDNIIGVFYIKDLFFLSEKEIQDFKIKKYLRNPFFVPESMKLNELFKEMKKRKVHMAIVIDEYGGTAGMTTMEDLIEEVFGDIEDEYDMEEEEIKKISENVYLIDPRMKIEDVNNYLKLDLPEENVTSIGGFILEYLGKLPNLKQKIIYENLLFIVEEMDKRRIKKLKLCIKKEQE